MSRRLDPRSVHTRVLDVLLRAGGPGLKPGVLHRTAQKVAAAILRLPLSSKDPIHFGTLSLVHGLNDLGDPLSEQAVLAIGRWVLRGRVIPVDRLREIVREARRAWLARCPCRASGRVTDLAPGLAPPVGADRARDAALLEPLRSAWGVPAVRAATAPPLAAAFDRAAAGGALAELHAATWPYWEILLDHPGYDPCWRKGLQDNGKAWPIPIALLGPWVDALYHGRGIVYTHMEAAGMPYAICSCPGPEADGGCILTNWHYASGNDEILVPNATAGHGQRRDDAGVVLPCRRHAARAAHPCLGCGCDHAAG